MQNFCLFSKPAQYLLRGHSNTEDEQKDKSVAELFLAGSLSFSFRSNKRA
jgi:hypothetical protein